MDTMAKERYLVLFEFVEKQQELVYSTNSSIIVL
jgi:hypothetical protein